MAPPRRPRRRSRWKRILGWTAVGVGTLVLLLIVTVVVLLHSSRFHAYLLHTIQAKATQSLGNKVQLRDFTLSWSGLSPSVTLYDIVVYGTAPYSTPPLLQADLASAQVTVTSIWRRAWYLNAIRIERPVVHIFADNQGRTNLPVSSHPKSQSKVDIFELGVRHFLLERGEAYYNNEKSDLSADLHDLTLRVGFTELEKKYSGTLSYRNGHLQFRNTAPLPHELYARFSFTPSQFTLESAALRTAGSQFSLSATARNYAQPIAHATYNALLNTLEFRRLLASSSIPSGTIRLSGSVDYHSQPGRSFLDSTSVRGKLYSAELRATHPYAITVRDIAAQYGLTNGNAQVSGLHAALLGGTLNAELITRDLTGHTRSSLKVSLSNISTSAVQELAAPASQQRARLQGSLNATAEAGWGKTLSNLVVSAKADLSAALHAASSGSAFPLKGALDARYQASNEVLSVRPSFVNTPQTQISLNGEISRHSALQIRVQANQLHEIEELAAAFRPPESKALGLYGNANVAATVTGSTGAPQVNGQLTARDVRVRGTSWRLLGTQFSANPSSVRLSAGQLVPSARGHLNFGISAAMQHWSFTPSSEFQAHLVASSLDAAELARAAGLTTPVTGTISADLDAHGTELNPMGNGKVQIAKASVAEEPIKNLQITFQANGSEVQSQIEASLPAGSANAQLNYEPRRRAYQVSLNATGIKLGQLETVKTRNLQLSGVLNAVASGSGTLKDPGLQLKLEIPRLQVRNQVINNLSFTTGIANHIAKIDLSSDVLNTRAEGHGTIRLSGSYPADFSFDTKVLPLGPLFAMYVPAQAGNLTGQTELHATLRGPLKNRSQLVAHLEIPQLAVNYKDVIHLEAAGPIRADYNAGTLDVKRSVIRGTGTELTFQANVPAARDAPASMLLQGTVDLQLAQLFNPDIASGGQLRFDIDSFGRRSDPNIQGQVRIVNASFAEAGTPLGLRNGNGLLTLTRNRLEITRFSGQAGGGNVTASGGLLYRPELRFDLGLKADGVRVLYQQSIRTTLSSNLALTGGYDNALLRGQVNIEDLSFTSNFDLMEMAGSLGGGEATPPPTGGFQDNLRLNIGIQTPSGISPSSRTLSISGSADLTLRGTAAQPVMLGRISLNDGELIFRGNRYLVQSGTIEFRNPSRTEPIFDVSANTIISQYQIQMRFWGPADHLHTNYASDPALPPADIINLIAFGKTSEAAAANPTPPGSLGAESLVASQVSSQVTNRIEKLAGISQLSIDPVLGSSQQSPGARIAIQQRVTSKIFVTYSTDVTATQQQAIKVEYQMNRRTSFSAVRDQNGGFSFETTFRKRW